MTSCDVGAVDVEDAFGERVSRVMWLRGLVAFGGDVDGLVGGVGEQALLVGVDGVEEAFAAEVAVFDDGEGAAVEREAGGVGDPERAERLRVLVAAVGDEGDAVGVDLGLQDGDERGLVFADGDGFGEVVVEEVVEGGGGGVGDAREAAAASFVGARAGGAGAAAEVLPCALPAPMTAAPLAAVTPLRDRASHGRCRAMLRHACHWWNCRARVRRSPSMLLSWVCGVSWASWAMGISGRRE